MVTSKRCARSSNRWSPADVVELFDELSDEEDLAGIKMMSGPQRARVFEYLDRRSQKHLLGALPQNLFDPF